MKNNLLFAFILMLIASSCQQEGLMINSDIGSELTSDLMSESEAIQLAEEMYQLHYPSLPKSRSSRVENVQVIRGKQARSLGDSLIYVVNFANNAGYVMLAAPRIEEPLIAVVENGNYNTYFGTDNPGLKDFLQMAEQYVASAPINDSKIDTSKFKDFERLPVYKKDSVVVAEYGKDAVPFVGIKWGQNYPENLYTPNRTPCGCVATAIAQLMSFYEPSTPIQYTYPQATKSSEVINWLDVRMIRTSSYTNFPSCDLCYADENSHQVLGRLCRQIGHLGFAEYHDEGTSISSARVIPLLNTFITNMKVENWENYSPFAIMHHIDNGPVFMASTSHAWIADSYYYKKTQYAWYKLDHIFQVWHYDSYIGESVINSVHFNWGWNGRDDGYFSGSVCALENGVQQPLWYVPFSRIQSN